MKMISLWFGVLLVVIVILLLGAGLVIGAGIVVALLVKMLGKKKNKAEETLCEES